MHGCMERGVEEWKVGKLEGWMHEEILRDAWLHECMHDSKGEGVRACPWQKIHGARFYDVYRLHTVPALDRAKV
jgi:hypothetical protein